MMFRRALLIGLLLTTGGCSFYMGEPRLPKTDFRATLNGASEVPPTDTRGTGYFAAVYRPSTKVLEYRLNVVGLSGPVTMAYLHGPAPAGENAQKVAPINVPFYADRSTIDDGVTLTEGQAAEVLAGRWYVNVMTEKFPDGEIRGQILPLKK
jgi:hypothetical protein